VSRGFVYVRESDKLIDDATDLVYDDVTEALEKGITDWAKLKNIVKDALSDYIWKKTKRRPMIMPIIMDTNF
jgi:ribonuclease J